MEKIFFFIILALDTIESTPLIFIQLSASNRVDDLYISKRCCKISLESGKGSCFKVERYIDFSTDKINKKLISGFGAAMISNFQSHILLKLLLGKFKEKVNFNSAQVTHGPIKATTYVFENTAYISDCNDLSITNEKSSITNSI